MKINKITNAQEFFKVVDDCKGRVELLTGEGDRLNMKSKLCQFIKIISASFSTVKSTKLMHCAFLSGEFFSFPLVSTRQQVAPQCSLNAS